MKLAISIGLCLALCFTARAQSDVKATQLSYLAMGDSYTSGSFVSQQESFPFQLVSLLNAKGLSVADPSIIAKAGWTTTQLIQAVKSAEAASLKFDIVTLLIGVNNQYRRYDIDIYRTEFRKLLKTAITLAGGQKSHVFVISIPDWGVTPFGVQTGRGTDLIAREIAEYNEINKKETVKNEISYTDVTPGSQVVATDLSLTASDGLHPSGKMYKEWVELLAPALLKVYK